MLGELMIDVNGIVLILNEFEVGVAVEVELDVV